MGYLAYRDNSTSYILSGAQYTSNIGGTARLNIRTGTGTNDIVKYGFTTDTSASQYCKLAFNIGGKTCRIGRSTTTSFPYQTTYTVTTSPNAAVTSSKSEALTQSSTGEKDVAVTTSISQTSTAGTVITTGILYATKTSTCDSNSGTQYVKSQVATSSSTTIKTDSFAAATANRLSTNSAACWWSRTYTVSYSSTSKTTEYPSPTVSSVTNSTLYSTKTYTTLYAKTQTSSTATSLYSSVSSSSNVNDTCRKYTRRSSIVSFRTTKPSTATAMNTGFVTSSAYARATSETYTFNVWSTQGAVTAASFSYWTIYSKTSYWTNYTYGTSNSYTYLSRTGFATTYSSTAPYTISYSKSKTSTTITTGTRWSCSQLSSNATSSNNYNI